MHEMSLARCLLAQVGHLVEAHGGGTVRSIRVQLGPLSGVEPLLLASAFSFSHQVGLGSLPRKHQNRNFSTGMRSAPAATPARSNTGSGKKANTVMVSGP